MKHLLPDFQLNLLEYDLDGKANRECIAITDKQAKRLISFMRGKNIYGNGGFTMWITASLNKDESLKSEQEFISKNKKLNTK